MQRQLRVFADGNGQVLKRTAVAHKRDGQVILDRERAGGKPRDVVDAGARDGVLFNEIPLRRIRRSRLRGGRGDVLRARRGGKRRDRAVGVRFADAAARADGGQRGVFGLAATPDEILRVADQRAGCCARVGAGGGDLRVGAAERDGRFIARGRVARETAGVAVGARQAAVVDALCQRARQTTDETARAVCAAGGGCDRAEIGAVFDRILAGIAHADKSTHAARAADRAVGRAGFERCAARDVGGDAARVRPGGGDVYIHRAVADGAAVRVGDEPGGVGGGGFALGAAAEREVLDRRAHGAAEQGAVAALVIRAQPGDLVPLRVKCAAKRAANARADGCPDALRACRVAGERNIRAQPDGHARKVRAAVDQRGEPRELFGGREGVGGLLAGIP